VREIASGRTYYWHKDRNETVWTPPDAYLADLEEEKKGALLANKELQKAQEVLIQAKAEKRKEKAAAKKAAALNPSQSISSMSYMQVKKALIAKGIDKAEVDSCMGRPACIALAAKHGIQ